MEHQLKINQYCELRKCYRSLVGACRLIQEKHTCAQLQEDSNYRDILQTTVRIHLEILRLRMEISQQFIQESAEQEKVMEILKMSSLKAAA